jgi:hypothetical protein
MKSWDRNVEVDNLDHLEISHDWDAWVGIDTVQVHTLLLPSTDDTILDLVQSGNERKPRCLAAHFIE